MKTWILIAFDNDARKTLGEVAKFEAPNTTEARQVVINEYPQYFYGANIIEVNADGSHLESGDFVMVPVRSYFEHYGDLPV